MNAPKFFTYQWKWLADPSPFKIGLWARQTGKDFICAAEAVYDSTARPNNHWLIVACGERQARESLEQAKSFALRNAEEIASISDTEIRFTNGSRITALPAKPETIRGYSANLILTEFSFHDHPDEVWRAVFPILTNPLKAGAKKLRIISTPNGHSNRFHELWHADDKTFFKQKVTIHDAVEAGLPINIPLLRSGLGDAEAWAQEYQCEFIDQSSVLLPYDLIATCESAEATETSTPQILSSYSGEMFLGIDFARKHDLTVAWMVEKIPAEQAGSGGLGLGEGNLDPNRNLNPNLASSSFHSAQWIYVTREVLILEKASTPDQLEQLIPRIHRARRVCLDCTGPGIGLGDLLVRQFGEYKANATHGRIELCAFTQGLKQELFSHLRSAFERRILGIPISSGIREDLHSIQRIVSANGQLSFRAAHTADGHSDRCTALALALRAAESTPPAACATIVGRRFPHLRR